MQAVGVTLNLSPKMEYFNTDIDLNIYNFVVCLTDRGVEFGKVVKLNVNQPTQNKILRKASIEDIRTNKENLQKADEIKPRVKEIVDKFNLNMRVSKCEYTFDREKLVIHYTADDRVDFRELVKVLASEFKARIEMHQISSRDETQLMGAIGCCGRVCCCKNHLCDFDKVSIKMAKKQGLSLNPQKLNGICGKLLCCLRYENEYYEEMCEKMPKVGEKVSTPDGVGVVKSNDMLKEKVEIVFTRGDETERKMFDLKEINSKNINENKQDNANNMNNTNDKNKKNSNGSDEKNSNGKNFDTQNKNS